MAGRQSVQGPSASKDDHIPGKEGNSSFPMQLYHNPPWDFAISPDHSVIHDGQYRKRKAQKSTGEGYNTSGISIAFLHQVHSILKVPPAAFFPLQPMAVNTTPWWTSLVTGHMWEIAAHLYGTAPEEGGTPQSQESVSPFNIYKMH